MTTMISTRGVARPARIGDTGGAGVCVPWATVLPLAVVAAYGSGFWLVSMREAVGAIERTSGPFVAWLQESTLLLPLYAFAVLAALTLALRWFGPHPRRARTIAVTLLLVVAATTLAAVAVQAISAVYDYRLQATHVATMAAHGDCDPACVADRQHSALLLQARALGLNGLVVLVSNLVLLSLLVALRGGRLDVASPRRHLGPGRRLNRIAVVLVAGLLGAAAIHAAVTREHLAEWPAAGIFFMLLTIAQVAVAVLFLLRLRSASILATAIVSAGPILLWLYSRTIGLPFGPEAGAPEQIGLADVAALLLETSTLVLALAALRSRPRPRRPNSTPHLTTLALIAMLAATVVGVAGGVGLIGGGGHTHGAEHAHQDRPTAIGAPA